MPNNIACGPDCPPIAPVAPIAPVVQLREALQEYYRAPVTVTVLRIPHAAEYLAVLDAEVLDAVDGRKSPQNALDAAAQQWRKLLETHGRDRQAKAYLRSLPVATDE